MVRTGRNLKWKKYLSDVRRSEICLSPVTKELDGLGQIILPLSTLVATSAK